MTRSDRIAQNLTATSTTPRSGQKHLEELARLMATAAADHAPVDELLYTEAKLALGAGEVVEAGALLARCPTGYKNAAQYAGRCATYTRLCEEGIIRARASQALRRAVADALGIQEDGIDASCYAARLHAAGYTAAAVRALGVGSVRAIAATAAMAEGHAHALRVHAEANTPPAARWAFHLTEAVERCATPACFAATAAAWQAAREGAAAEGDADAGGETAA